MDGDEPRLLGSGKERESVPRWRAGAPVAAAVGVLDAAGPGQLVLAVHVRVRDRSVEAAEVVTKAQAPLIGRGGLGVVVEKEGLGRVRLPGREERLKTGLGEVLRVPLDGRPAVLRA